MTYSLMITEIFSFVGDLLSTMFVNSTMLYIAIPTFIIIILVCGLISSIKGG